MGSTEYGQGGLVYGAPGGQGGLAYGAPGRQGAAGSRGYEPGFRSQDGGFAGSGRQRSGEGSGGFGMPDGSVPNPSDWDPLYRSSSRPCHQSAT